MRRTWAEQRWTLLGVLAAMLFMYAGILRPIVGPWSLLLGIAGLLLGGWMLWYLRYANRWRGFTAPAGTTFRPAVTELPIVADHRDVFGDGKIRNVLEGEGFVAFEIVRQGARQWAYVVPLAEPQPSWHVKPPRYNNGRIPGVAPVFSDLYVVEGRVPEPVKRILMEPGAPVVDLGCAGNLLIARELGISGRRFAKWAAAQGRLVARVADALEPAPDAADAQRGLPGRAVDPSRNVWQAPSVGCDARPQKQPVEQWRQPPRA